MKNLRQSDIIESLSNKSSCFVIIIVFAKSSRYYFRIFFSLELNRVESWLPLKSEWPWTYVLLFGLIVMPPQRNTITFSLPSVYACISFIDPHFKLLFWNVLFIYFVNFYFLIRKLRSTCKIIYSIRKSVMTSLS